MITSFNGVDSIAASVLKKNKSKKDPKAETYGEF